VEVGGEAREVRARGGRVERDPDDAQVGPGAVIGGVPTVLRGFVAVELTGVTNGGSRRASSAARCAVMNRGLGG
jgi:hypothetical protein